MIKITKIENLLKNNLFQKITIVFLLMIGLGQIIYFGNSNSWNDVNSIVALSLTSFGSVFSIIATFTAISLKPNFFKHQLIADFFLIPGYILLHLWVLAIQLVIFSIFYYISSRNWKKDSLYQQKLVPKTFGKFDFVILFLIVSGFTLFFGFLVDVYINPSFYNFTNYLFDSTPYASSIILVFVVVASILLIKRFTIAWLFFFIGDFATFFALGIIVPLTSDEPIQISSALLGLIYAMISLFSFLVWRNITKLEK